MTDVDVTQGSVLTIDELARRVGMSVRNLREWRALGLLRAPEMRGRVGHYDAGDVARIERIKQMHAQGFTLELIARLLDASGDAGDEAISMARALREAFRDEYPPRANLAELARRWGTIDPRALRRAVKLGLIREREDGGYEFTNARVERVGGKLADLGLSGEQALEATAEIRSHLDGIARLFENVWLEHVWEPFVDAGRPAEQWSEIRTTLEQMQPLAMDTVIGLFQVAMEAQIESGVARDIERAEAQK